MSNAPLQMDCPTSELRGQSPCSARHELPNSELNVAPLAASICISIGASLFEALFKSWGFGWLGFGWLEFWWFVWFQCWVLGLGFLLFCFSYCEDLNTEL